MLMSNKYRKVVFAVSEGVTLAQFIESNWVVLSLLVSLLLFVIKMTYKVTIIANRIDLALDTQNKRVDEIEKSQRGLKEELRKSMQESYKELRKGINDDNKELRKDLMEGYESLSKRMDSMEGKRIAGGERTRIIMDGVEATLMSLRDEGHDGLVTKSLEAIQEYKSRRASE